MTSELLAIELDAAEQDVLFSRTVLETAKARLAIDVKRLEAVQARIEHEKQHEGGDHEG